MQCSYEAMESKVLQIRLQSDIMQVKLKMWFY